MSARLSLFWNVVAALVGLALLVSAWNHWRKS